MKQTRSLSLIVLFLFITVGLSAAKGIFFGQNATGSGTGTDCFNTLSVSFFNTATNWGTGAGQIGPGTSAHLCGTITTQLTAQGSGTASSPITIQFETNAKISLPKCDNGNGCLSIGGLNYIIVDGGTNGIIENTANGTDLTFQASSIGVLVGGCNNCEVRKLTIQNLYVRMSVSDTYVPGPDGCIYGGNSSNLSIHDITCHDVHWAMVFNFTIGQSSNWNIYNNNCYNTDHCLALAGPSSSNAWVTLLLIHDNHFHDFANWDITGCTQFHHDGIHFFGQPNGPGSPSAPITNVIIYNNLIDGDYGACMSSPIFAEANAVGNSGWQVFNNVIIQANPIRQTPNGMLALSSQSNSIVANNTVIGSNNNSNGDVCYGSGNTAGITFKNNIASGCNNLLSTGNVQINPGAWDNNVYNFGNIYNSFVWNQSVFTSSLATWQTACACDAHAKYPYAPGSLMLDSTGHPLAGSPAIGAGANLTSLGISGLNVDRAGNPRPATGSWDAGAYVFSASTVNPPTSLTVVVK